MKLVEELSSALDTREAVVRQWESRYVGDSPFILLTASQRDQLDDRLKSLRIPLEGLAVDALNERLRIVGWSMDEQADLSLWQRWEDFGGPELAEQVQRDIDRSALDIASWASSQAPCALRARPRSSSAAACMPGR
jgi:hypothetical protein